MRLEPIEVYVLDSFRLQGRRSWLRIGEIAEGCTMIRRNALDDAVTRLESDALVVRTFEFVELTDTGRKYVTMAGIDAREHKQVW